MSNQNAEILIVDDHELMRSGIRSLLSTRPEWHVCGEAVDGVDAVEKARSLKPDIVLMDVSMPRMDGLTAMRMVQKVSPDSNVIIVTQNDAASIRDQSARADGYVLKVHLHRDLIPTIERVLQTGVHHGHGNGNGNGAHKSPAPVEAAPAAEPAHAAVPEIPRPQRTSAGKPEATVRARNQSALERRNVEISEHSEQLEELSSRLQQGQDEERRRIARELHDSAGQLLAVLRLNLDQARPRIADDAAAKSIEYSAGLVEQLDTEIRNLSYLLHPPLLDESGLAGAVRWYARGLSERSKFDVRVDMPEDFGRLPADMEVTLFRIVQECLTNIVRHSQSTTAFIHLAHEGGEVQLAVRDEGRGIHPETLAGLHRQKAGVGIAGIRERVRHFGGTMNIDSDDHGTTVTVTLPLPANFTRSTF